eukprot:10662595-Heterocapsa_arctica.AAC.1
MAENCWRKPLVRGPDLNFQPLVECRAGLGSRPQHGAQKIPWVLDENAPGGVGSRRAPVANGSCRSAQCK